MKLSILLLFILINIVSAQDKCEYFPDKLNIQPFTANILEPKLGFVFKTAKNELRMDIGNSVEILHYKDNDSSVFSVGADMFTYSLLRKETDFHFPVDAIDYLFGFNGGYKVNNGNKEYGVRLRLSHISTHMVDGHLDNYKDTTKPLKWHEGIPAKVYSREFLEIFPYYRYDDIRVYAGYTYIYHIDPTYLGKNNFQLGFDYFLRNVLGDKITPFIGYDLKFVKINKMTGNNSIAAGIKFGNALGKGFSLVYNYYAGYSFHGQYYKYKEIYRAFGFNLDL